MEDTQTQQPAAMAAKPQQEHEWLAQLVGEWTYEVDVPDQDGGEPKKFTGNETVRSIGGLWIVAEGRGQTPDGSEATTIMTLGYDPARQRYIGTWIGSMMTHMWIYDGQLDPAANRLDLYTDGPDMFVEGKTARYRESIELRSRDERVFTSHVLRDDGTELQMMTAVYRRQG